MSQSPGPWKLDTWNGWLLSAENVGIVKFDINRTILADARLIAEAPAMLEVLRAIEMKLVCKYGYERYEVNFGEIREIIQRIEGDGT